MLDAVVVCRPRPSTGGGTGEPNNPYLIYDSNQMQAIGADSNDWDKCFKLMADIDLSGITYTTAVIAFDTDYSSPFSFDGVPFTGDFDGNGYRILNLTIDTEGLDKDYLGLCGLISAGAVVYNLGLEDVNVSGSGEWVNGDFTGDFGALVGDNSGVIKNCWISGSVKGGNFSEDVGGLCGWNQITGSITCCYVMGSVICGPNSGGIGGLCGSNDGSIADCWASSSVTGRNSLGGLCGFLYGGSITNSYSIGSVNGIAECLGGLCGERDGGIIINCFWDLNTSGQETSAGGEGKTIAEMHQQSTFEHWDFINVWDIVENQTYPYLRIHLAGDINKDGVVNFKDIAIICEQWLEDE